MVTGLRGQSLPLATRHTLGATWPEEVFNSSCKVAGEGSGVKAPPCPQWQPHSHLGHSCLRLLSAPPSRSSARGGRAGSCPGSGSWGQGCSSPWGRETPWQIWCLWDKESRNFPGNRSTMLALNPECCSITSCPLCQFIPTALHGQNCVWVPFN